MDQSIEAVEVNAEIVQDNEEIVQIPHNLLDRIGGGCLIIDL